jgi:carboxylesterase
MPQVSVMKGAEPWASEGDTTGVLVVHGFTGTPQSVRYWAEGIAADGRTVILPRLPGHGTTPDDMQRTTAAEWVAEAEMGLRGLRERCDRIFVCGLSMGGTITFDLAERFGDVLSGIVTVNASMFTKDPRTKLAPLLGLFPLKLKGIASDIADPAQEELAYRVVPTKAAASMLSYQARVMARLPEVRMPVLLMSSRNDHVVHTTNSPYILEHISSTDKELVWLEKSYHVATLDYDKDLIVERTNRFIKEHTT